MCTAHHRYVHTHDVHVERGVDGGLRIELPHAPPVPEEPGPPAIADDALSELAELPCVDAMIVSLCLRVSTHAAERLLREREREGRAVACGDGLWQLVV